MSAPTPLLADERVVTCGPHMRLRVQRLHDFEAWQTYATPDERLPGEFGKIDNVRLVCAVKYRQLKAGSLSLASCQPMPGGMEQQDPQP